MFLAADSLIQSLHDTNHRLRFWLEAIHKPSPAPRAITPAQMAGLLSELLRAGEWLRNLPADRSPALVQELDEYRKHVERLHELLPSIHRTLLSERARLEQERARVESAAAWARGSQQTL